MSFDELTVGHKIKIQDGGWTPKGEGWSLPYHVRGFIDGQIIVRQWVPWKGRWRYEVQTESWFDVWKESGRLKVRK